jgi:aspartate/methionine/tyrosine aminotransferase
MRYTRMPIEMESPEEIGYGLIRRNLAESSLRDKTLKELNIPLEDLTLWYGEHRGYGPLRAEIALQGDGLAATEVLVTTGAAGALFIIATALLKKGDHLIVIRPNYATNLETPKAIGADITYIDLVFEENFRLDPDEIESALRPETRLISLTVPHNPTGTMISQEVMKSLISMTERWGCYILFDETYRDLSISETLPVAASLSPKAISVSSLSKAYGVPGLRIGWLITKDTGLYNLFLAAKEQMGICGSVIDEYLGHALLLNRAAQLDQNRHFLEQRLDLVCAWILREPLISWVQPAGGVVCMPRIALSDKQMDYFYQYLMDDHQTYVAPGHWFDMPRQFFRVGYGWPTEAELKSGLESISEVAHRLVS